MDDIEGTMVVWHMVIDEPIDVGLGPEPPVSEYCSFCGNMFSDNIYERVKGDPALYNSLRIQSDHDSGVDVIPARRLIWEDSLAIFSALEKGMNESVALISNVCE